MGESPPPPDWPCQAEKFLTGIHVTALTVTGLKGNPFLFPPGVVIQLPWRPGVYCAGCAWPLAQQQTHDVLLR